MPRYLLIRETIEHGEPICEPVDWPFDDEATAQWQADTLNLHQSGHARYYVIEEPEASKGVPF